MLHLRNLHIIEIKFKEKCISHIYIYIYIYQLISESGRTVIMIDILSKVSRYMKILIKSIKIYENTYKDFKIF